MKVRPIIFLIVIASLILTACQAPSTSGKISFMVFGDPAELAAYQKLVDAFTKSHSTIQVELIHIPGQVITASASPPISQRATPPMWC